MSQTSASFPSQQPASKPPVTKPKPPLLPQRPKFIDFKQLQRDHSDLQLKPRHKFIQSPTCSQAIVDASSTQRSSLVIMESVKRGAGPNGTYQLKTTRDSVSQFNMRQSLGNSSQEGAEPNMASVTSEGFKKQLNNFASKLASGGIRRSTQEKPLIQQINKNERNNNNFSSNLPPKSSSPILREAGSKKRKRWEDLYQEDRLKRDRLLRQSSEYESLKKSFELQQCTFKPQIPKRPEKENNLTPKKNDLYEKGIKWKKEIDQKNKAKQNEKITSEMATLTFQPTLLGLDRDKLQLSPLMNNGGVKVGPKRKILEGSMRAMEHFISRMTRAKIENTNKQEQVQLPRNLPNTPLPRVIEVSKEQLSKSPSMQQLSFVSTMTPRSNNQSRSPLNLSKFTDIQSKKVDNSSVIKNDVTLCTSLYLQNRYSMKKKTTPTKIITPSKVKKQPAPDMKIQNFEIALSKLHMQIQNFNV